MKLVWGICWQVVDNYREFCNFRMELFFCEGEKTISHRNSFNKVKLCSLRGYTYL